MPRVTIAHVNCRGCFRSSRFIGSVQRSPNSGAVGRDAIGQVQHELIECDLALHTPGTEEALINLDDAEERALSLAGREDPLPQATIDPVHRVAVHAANPSRLKRREIGCKALHNCPNSGFREFRTFE